MKAHSLGITSKHRSPFKSLTRPQKIVIVIIPCNTTRQRGGPLRLFIRIRMNRFMSNEGESSSFEKVGPIV